MPNPLSHQPLAPLLATSLTPDVVESGDAAAGRGTTARMQVGEVFGGTLAAHDHDWVAVTLTAGQTYRITMTGNGPGAMSDTFLTLRGPGGAALVSNDDAGSWDTSVVTLTATATGTYFIDASGYGASAGAYALQVEQARPWTMDQIADYLTEGFWQDSYSWPRQYDVRAGGVITVNLTALGADARGLAEAALSSWTQVSGLRFQQVGHSAANITFDEVDDGNGAYAEVLEWDGDAVARSLVRIPEYWMDQPGSGFASYEYQTYIHEIGHALGLGHAGAYNGSGSYATDALYVNDSWQASVMSYFDQIDNTHVDASYAFAITPMIADILAVQQLYGTPQNILAGDTGWGWGSNVVGGLGIASRLMAQGADITMTILDQGGTDVLNLANDAQGQRVNLNPGTISDCYGLVGNLSIARGTVIENISCGAAADIVWGNVAGNRILGNGGADTLFGGLGHDTLIGGAGADRLVGGMGNDTYHAAAGDVLVETANGGRDTVVTALNWNLAAQFENLQMQAGAIVGNGNAAANWLLGNAAGNRLSGGMGNDTLTGLAGDDTLTGGLGADRLVGGLGNDVYHRDAADTVIEAAGAGIDRIVTGSDIALAANVEHVTLTGTAAVRVMGNALDNNIVGNAAANVIDGGGGRDVIRGGGGADVFQFRAGSGGRITDWQDDVDTIRVLTGGDAGLSAASVRSGAIDSDAGVVLTLGGARLVIEGATVATLQDDLVFV